MATQKTRKSFKFAHKARNIGISALAAATIGGYTLYQRTASASDTTALLQTSGMNILAQTNPIPDTTTALYNDGEYQGDSIRASRWGNVQVTVIIDGGAITDFRIDDYPYHRSTSQRISQIAIPRLMQEAVEAQSADIDIISGATPTSEAFIESLQSALDKALVAATPTVGLAGASA